MALSSVPEQVHLVGTKLEVCHCIWVTHHHCPSPQMFMNLCSVAICRGWLSPGGSTGGRICLCGRRKEAAFRPGCECIYILWEAHRLFCRFSEAVGHMLFVPAASEREEAVPLLWSLNGEDCLTGRGTPEKGWAKEMDKWRSFLSILWTLGRGMILGFSGGVDMAKELRLHSTQGGLEHNWKSFPYYCSVLFSVCLGSPLQ